VNTVKKLTGAMQNTLNSDIIIKNVLRLSK
jgi:hypothetical protein